MGQQKLNFVTLELLALKKIGTVSVKMGQQELKSLYHKGHGFAVVFRNDYYMGFYMDGNSPAQSTVILQLTDNLVLPVIFLKFWFRLSCWKLILGKGIR